MKSISLACPHCNKNNSIESRQFDDDSRCQFCNKQLFSGKAISADQKNFDQLINTRKPVVVYFWATWCGPCKTFTPIFDKAAKELGNKFCFIKLDSQQNKALCNRYRIRGVPTLMVLKKGKRQAVLNGALRAKEFKAWLADSL